VRFPLCALLFAALSATSPKAQPQVYIGDRAAQPGTVSIHVEKVYYDVEGSTPDALAAQLGRHGPQVSGERYFGLTEWEVHAEYRWDKGRGGCRIKNLRVRASVQTHLPRWRRAATAPTPLSGAWRRFLAALDWHEHGHRILAEEAAESIRVKLAALRAPDCAQVEASAYEEMYAVLNEYERYNEDYDAATDHGRTQGATWPPSP
jgi:predicted secreted Zn-dependent protease